MKNQLRNLFVFTLSAVLASVCVASYAQQSSLADSLVDGLNVIVTSGEAQTQMMAMVLSMKTLEHNKEVNMVLCDQAGSLAIKDSSSPTVAPMQASPKQLLQKLIDSGANVKLCPLYLPNASKDESALIEGVSVADPDEIAKRLLDSRYNTLSY